jgi:hypothetical protein
MEKSWLYRRLRIQKQSGRKWYEILRERIQLQRVPLAVELVIGFGCGAGAALIASAAWGPGALACAFIVAAFQAAICELLFYPVSREAVCAGLGYC